MKAFSARSVVPRDVQAVREPLPFLRLIPSGGVEQANIGDYLKNGAFTVGVGGNLIDKPLVAARDWAALTDRARTFVEAAQV